MRIVDIADGYSSNTNPYMGQLTASKLVQYISDSAYVTANGSPTGGEIYFNTTVGGARIYDTNTSAWEDVGTSLSYSQENPIGLVNGTNKDFTITYAPLNSDSLIVYKDGVLVNKADYSYSLGVITFVTAPNIGEEIYCVYMTGGSSSIPPLSLTGQFSEYRTLTGGEISAKQIVLAQTPSEPSKTLLDWIGVCSQVYSVDFAVSGNVLSWNSLALDGVLTAGDILRIYYLLF
jgi:hypothetical protein